DVLEDLRDLRARVARDVVDVVDDLLDLASVLLDGLVELLDHLGYVLEDALDLILPTIAADRVLERLGDGLDVLEDVRALPLEGVDGRVVDVEPDLAVVGDAGPALGAGREDDERLADQARRALADGRVLVEGELGPHLDVDARLALLEREPL